MKVGLQMYSVKKMIAEDPISAFKKVAAIGYKNWEVCQLYDRNDLAWNYGLQMPPEEAVDFLADLGVQVIGSHLTSEQIKDKAYLHGYFDYMRKIGCKAVGLGSSLFPYNDIPGLLKQCREWEEVARMSNDYGLRFYYHNHFMEFQRFWDQTVFELLMENTDPRLVSFELDTFWAMRGGADPLALLENYAGRILYIHQKDFPKNFRSPLNLFSYKLDINSNLTTESFRAINEPDAFVEVGTGCLDIQAIIDAGNRAGVEYIILEQDRTQMGEENSIRTSMEAFKKYTGLSF